MVGIRGLKLTKWFSLLLLALCSICLLGSEAAAVDEEHCLFCHRYRGLSYIDADRNFRLLYITEDLYESSPHGIIKCSECHKGIDQFPHTNIEKVDCLSECHVDEPSANKPFSHKRVDDFLSKSAHSKYDQDGQLKEHSEDYPDCKTCHMDPLYRHLKVLDDTRPGIRDKTITRCSICHENNQFMSKFYNHFTSRMQKLRPPKELVEMCGECHNSPGVMERHGLKNVVHSYLETYHGKAVVFGDELAADCNDCHTLPGESIHSIHSKEDPVSATYPDNRYITCTDLDCHPGSDKKLAGYKPHVVMDMELNPVEYWVLFFFVCLTCGSFALVMLGNILAMTRLLFPNFSIPDFFRNRGQGRS